MAEDNNDISLAKFIETKLDIYFEAHNDAVPPANVYRTIVGEVENIVINYVLKHVGNNQTKAAKVLGINRNTLRYKIDKK